MNHSIVHLIETAVCVVAEVWLTSLSDLLCALSDPELPCAKAFAVWKVVRGSLPHATWSLSRGLCVFTAASSCESADSEHTDG